MSGRHGISSRGIPINRQGSAVGGGSDFISHTPPSNYMGSYESSNMKRSRTRGRTGSISGRLRSASDLEDKGFIDRTQKGHIKDLIISGDQDLESALDKYDQGDRSDLDSLLQQGLLTRTQSLDLLEDLDMGFLNMGELGGPRGGGVGGAGVFGADQGALGEVEVGGLGGPVGAGPASAGFDFEMSFDQAFEDRALPSDHPGSFALGPDDLVGHTNRRRSGSGGSGGSAGSRSLASLGHGGIMPKQRGDTFDFGSGLMGNSLANLAPAGADVGGGFGNLATMGHAMQMGVGHMLPGEENGIAMDGGNFAPRFAWDGADDIHQQRQRQHSLAMGGSMSTSSPAVPMPVKRERRVDSLVLAAGAAAEAVDQRRHSSINMGALPTVEGLLAGDGLTTVVDSGVIEPRGGSGGSSGAAVGPGASSMMPSAGAGGANGPTGSTPPMSITIPSATFRAGEGDNKDALPRAKVGAYSPESRRKRIERFMEKRKRRVWTKKVKYDVRKNFADSRMRVKGRFVKKEDEELLKELMSIT